MGSLIVAIIALGLAQLAVVVRVAIWVGGVDEKLKTKDAEIASLKGALAAEHAATEKHFEERQRVGDEARRELREELGEVRADLRKLTESRETLIRLEERGKVVLDALDDVEAVTEDLGRLRDDMRLEIKRVDGVLSAFPHAAARLEWRVENLEKVVEVKFRSHPRLFAQRPPPEPREETKPTRQLPAAEVVEILTTDRPSFHGDPKPFPTRRKGPDSG